MCNAYSGFSRRNDEEINRRNSGRIAQSSASGTLSIANFRISFSCGSANSNFGANQMATLFSSHFSLPTCLCVDVCAFWTVIVHVSSLKYVFHIDDDKM